MKRLSHAWYAAVLVLMATLANVSIAEEIQLGVAPTNPTQAGFSMFVMTERLGNEGFQPITLRFRATATTFTRQRQLRILFRPRTQYATEIDYQFGIDVTVPQDVASHDVRVMVPHFYRWETCSVQVIEDGRRLGKLPSKLVIPVAVNDWGQNMSIGILSPRDALKSDAPWVRIECREGYEK